MKNSVITSYDQTLQAVLISEAKTRLKIVDRSDFDIEVTRLIKVATQWIERRYGIAVLTQTREQRQDDFEFRSNDPFSRIELLCPPVQSVTSVIYTDESGALITLTQNTDYATSGLMTPVAGAQDITRGSVYPLTSWPSTKNVPEAVKIVYVCGYGNASMYIPEPIRESILRLVVFMFENPMDEVIEGRLDEFQMNISAFMSTYEQFGSVRNDLKRLEFNGTGYAYN